MQVLRGEEWYVQQAARAVNEAVGRVIRHRDDHGAIILCDERFSQGSNQNQMSLWLRPHVRCYAKFGDASYSLTRFFRDRNPTEDVLLPKKNLKDDQLNPHGETKLVAQASFVSMPTIPHGARNVHRAEDDTRASGYEVLGRRTTTVSGQLGIQGAETGGSATTSRPSLSAMLAASRQKAGAQLLSTASITPAHQFRSMY